MSIEGTMMNFIFDKIEERDVDFVVMRAFAEIPEFTALFLQKVGYSTGDIISMEHSFTDLELGESDITVILDVGGRKFGLLIENKIDAGAMPNQYRRYVLRGERGVNNGEYHTFAIFLIAPESYIKSNNEAKKYENVVTYEEILSFFIAHSKDYDSCILRAAITKQVQGYVVREVPAITEFWRKLYAYCCTMEQTIEMYSAEGPKGPRSNWPQFKVPLKGVALYYKANQGVVDLQFSGKLAESSRLKTDLLIHKDADMHWVDTGASLSLRIKVKPMDFRQPFESYIKELPVMTEAVARLTALAVNLNDTGYIV